MLSLMLGPGGYDRSVITLHLPVVCPFGITQKGLRWTSTPGLNGPMKRLASFSLVKYLSITARFDKADRIFDLDEDNCWSHLKPIQKLSVRPVVIKSRWILSGWTASAACHAETFSGVVTSCAVMHDSEPTKLDNRSPKTINRQYIGTHQIGYLYQHGEKDHTTIISIIIIILLS